LLLQIGFKHFPQKYKVTKRQNVNYLTDVKCWMP